MADRSQIEWTDATLNPVRARNPDTGRVGWHCEHASPGCRGCYAETFNRRLGTGLPYVHRSTAELFLDRRVLEQLGRWRRPRLVFVGSMTDLFAPFVPWEWIDEVLAAAAAAPRHTLQLLTKRPELAAGYLAARSGRPLSNIWFGTSAEDQPWLDRRSAPMAAIASMGWHTWCSAEPLLGPMSIRGADWVQWLVVGGESGARARPMLPRWVDTLRVEAGFLGVPFFFKQWGGWRPPAEAEPAEQGDLVRYLAVDGYGASAMERVGKRDGGALLHGRLWQCFPDGMVLR